MGARSGTWVGARPNNEEPGNVPRKETKIMRERSRKEREKGSRCTRSLLTQHVRERNLCVIRRFPPAGVRHATIINLNGNISITIIDMAHRARGTLQAVRKSVPVMMKTRRGASGSPAAPLALFQCDIRAYSRSN